MNNHLYDYAIKYKLTKFADWGQHNSAGKSV